MVSTTGELVDTAVAVPVHQSAESTKTTGTRRAVDALLALADLRSGQRVLEIGTGSGYSAAAISAIIGKSGHVSSIDIQPELTERAKAQGVPNSSFVTADGMMGHPLDDRQYDRVIAWVTPPILPSAWVDQTQEGGRIVSSVSVAPVAGANLTVAVDVVDREPVNGSFSEGSFVDMRGQSTDPRYPSFFCDASAVIDDEPSWLSAQAVRHDLARAAALLERLARNDSRPRMNESVDMRQMLGYLASKTPNSLASIRIPAGRGFGYVTVDSAAFIVDGTIVTDGSGLAWEMLDTALKTWAGDGRPGPEMLPATFTKIDMGWKVSSSG